MIKAVLFDSDGVLVDSERMFFEATRDSFVRAGVALDACDWGRWYLSEGRHSAQIARELGIADSRIDEVIQQRNREFYARIAEGVPVKSGIRQLLEQLSGTYRLAVVTGADREHFNRVHESSGLARYFETVVTRDDCRAVKPDPEAYLSVLKRLGLSADDCLAVEDSPRGAVSAVAAGIRCAIVRTDLTNVELCPPECIVLEDVSYIPNLVAARQ